MNKNATPEAFRESILILLIAMQTAGSAVPWFLVG